MQKKKMNKHHLCVHTPLPWTYTFLFFFLHLHTQHYSASVFFKCCSLFVPASSVCNFQLFAWPPLSNGTVTLLNGKVIA